MKSTLRKTRIDSLETLIEKTQTKSFVEWPDHGVTLPPGQRDKNRVNKIFAEVISSQPDSYWSEARITMAARLALVTLEVDKIHQMIIAEKYQKLSTDNKALLTLITSLGNERDRLGRALKLTTMTSGDYELLRDEKKHFGGTKVRMDDKEDSPLSLLASVN